MKSHSLRSKKISNFTHKQYDNYIKAFLFYQPTKIQKKIMYFNKKV